MAYQYLTEMNVDHIVDVATLTGAATIALGNRYAGVMGHGEAVNLVQSGGCRSGRADVGDAIAC